MPSILHVSPRLQWSSCPARTASATTRSRMPARSISRRGRTCFCTPSSRVRWDRELHPIVPESKGIDALTQLAPDPELVDKLVVANRILYQQGVVDGFGHVSARHDKTLGR